MNGLTTAAEATRPLFVRVLRLWGISAVCIDAYEAGVRALSESQRTLAAAIDAEPAHSIATASADLTRDIGAAVASRARWILDA